MKKNEITKEKIKLKKYKYIYLIALPSVLFIIIFKIIPLFGLQLAFKNYNYNSGIWGSEWIGLDNFNELFTRPEFWQACKNTLIIGLMHLFISFPISIIFAIFLSEIKNKKIRNFMQIVSTFPHFLSWVLVASILFNLLGSSGFINSIISSLGGDPISFFSNNHAFRWILVFSYVWKETGWNSIVFYAAICGIDRTLYEAAEIDGASKLQKIFKITLPGIKNVIIAMFLIQLGGIFSAGFSQVFNLYNPTVYESGDILETYIYRMTFSSSNNFGLSAAISLIESILNMILLIIAELICKKTTKESLFGELFSTKEQINAKK